MSGSITISYSAAILIHCSTPPGGTTLPMAIDICFSKFGFQATKHKCAPRDKLRYVYCKRVVYNTYICCTYSQKLGTLDAWLSAPSLREHNYFIFCCHLDPLLHHSSHGHRYLLFKIQATKHKCAPRDKLRYVYCKRVVYIYVVHIPETGDT